jgi:cytochrome b
MNDESTLLRVWDLPTRLFHWTLALCVVASIVSARIGGNAMVWHFWLGYTAFALLAFRLAWGVVGGHWSRFRTFVRAPTTVLRYLRGQGRADQHHEVGHNPLGALSVLALLALLCAQVGTGLFADDDIASTGPLISFVSEASSHALTRWHKGVGQWLIIGLLLLHVGAIGYYLIGQRRNLVRAMLSGDKSVDATQSAPAAVDNARTRLLALLLFAGCVGLVAWVVRLGG